jgi:membrane-associated phospholipid phosphatase
MTELVPDQRNRFAVIIGRVLHPYFLPIPTVFAILYGIPFQQALEWAAVVLAIVLLPGITCAAYLEHHGHLLYERRTRGPLYLVGWLSILVCLAVVVTFQAPRALIASIATLAVWAPLQLAINARVTKISTHAAVAAGCFTGLVVLGKAGPPLVEAALLALVIITLWARVVTRNHTVSQVIYGALLGAGLVFVIFPLVLA